MEVKIIEVSSPQVVNGGKRKQEVVLSDETGTATLTLWETDIDKVELSKSYTLTKLVVRIFRDSHFMSLPITGGTITDIKDISDVSPGTPIPHSTALKYVESSSWKLTNCAEPVMETSCNLATRWWDPPKSAA
jgi:hypothetical protein